MKHITINQTTYDTDRDEFRTVPIASFVIDESGIASVEFGEEAIPDDLTLVDYENDRTIGLSDDPLRWAELLPSAYRSGDYVVSVSDRVRPRPQVFTSVPQPALAMAELTGFDATRLR